MPADEGGPRAGQFLSFLVAEREYALGIADVTEIIEYSPPTRVPSVPPFIKGVVNVRGGVVPVLDLAVRFGLGETPITRWACIVLVSARVEGAPATIGLLADRVKHLAELSFDDVEPLPSMYAEREFVRGTTKPHTGRVLLLDIDRLLASDERSGPIGSAPSDAAGAAADLSTTGTKPSAAGDEPRGAK